MCATSGNVLDSLREGLYAMHMGSRFYLFLAFVVLLTACFGCAAKTTRSRPGDAAAAQKLVDEAAVLLEDSLAKDVDGSLKQLLGRARGVMIIPGIGNVSFLFSVGGGYGIVMANTDAGWTGPVFLSKGTFGFGFQAGFAKQTGLLIFMHEDDVRYLLETGAILRGQARAVILNAELEANQTPEFFDSGDVYFVGDHSGLYAGIAIDGGGFSDRVALNEACSGVKGGGPLAILYKQKAQPEGARKIRDMLDAAREDGELAVKEAAGYLEKQKDGTEVPSN